MTGLEIGLISVGAIVLLIYSGMHVGIALSLVSFLSVALQKDSPTLAMKLLTLAAADGIADQTFAVIPLFVLMGLIMSASDVGRDAYDVGDYFLRRVRGGLGIATVGSNAVFAAVTGVSIASAAVFTRVAVPEMLRLGYSPRFAVGTVAGSSVSGHVDPAQYPADNLCHPDRAIDWDDVLRGHWSRHPALDGVLPRHHRHGVFYAVVCL